MQPADLSVVMTSPDDIESVEETAAVLNDRETVAERRGLSAVMLLLAVQALRHGSGSARAGLVERGRWLRLRRWQRRCAGWARR